MSSIDECPFCNLNLRVLKENQLAATFLSDPRKMPGHFIVIPKRHVEQPWKISDDELRAIFDLVRFIQRRVVGELSAGCDVRQNYRPFKTQSKFKIDHVHYHVMPRDFEDELFTKADKYETALFADLTEEEHDRMAKILEDTNPE